MRWLWRDQVESDGRNPRWEVVGAGAGRWGNGAGAGGDLGICTVEPAELADD